MTHDRNQVMLKIRDVGVWVAILTLVWMSFGPLHKIVILNDLIPRVDKLEDASQKEKQDIAVIVSQYVDIQRQLEQINGHLRRLNR